MSYMVDGEKLKKHYEELIRLEDWVPFHIRMRLPTDGSIRLGSKVRNRNLYNKRMYRHKVHNETSSLDGPDLLKWEDERFMEKYPQFAYLFTKVNP